LNDFPFISTLHTLTVFSPAFFISIAMKNLFTIPLSIFALTISTLSIVVNVPTIPLYQLTEAIAIIKHNEIKITVATTMLIPLLFFNFISFPS